MSPETNDLVIAGGTVVDGTGAAGVRADVGVRDGRIVAIGEDLVGDVVLDATDHVVAPGVIDIHTHYDAQVFWDPQLTPSCFHGVTTVVAGNCGFSIAPTRPEHRDLVARTLENVEDMDVDALRAGVPTDFSTFPEYLASVERHGLGLNFTCYLGHTALRLFVMGDDAYEREATDAEIAQMQAVLGDGLEAGAAGFATSFAPTHRGADGKPVPSRFADRRELDALLHTLGEVGQGVGAFTAGELVGIEDLYDLQLQTGVPFTFTAIMSRPNRFHRRQLEINEEGWARGAEVWPQVSPRPLRFAITMAEPFTLNPNPAFAALMGRSSEERTAAYRDPAWRASALEAWALEGVMVPRWETFEVAESRSHPELVGRRLTDLASEKEREPFDFLLDLAVEELDVRVACVVANDDEVEVAELLRSEHVTLGVSDAGAHVGQLCDAPLPTDLLGPWVRDREVMSLEEAVRRLTSVQADLFGLPDRGRLALGQWADVMVFDPESVAPGPVRRVTDFPAGSSRLTADQPLGMRHVLVNGVPIRRDGAQLAHQRPGAVVAPAPR